MLTLTFVSLFAIAIGLTYVWLNEYYAYWRRKGVAEERPVLFWGNMRGYPKSLHWMDINTRIYNRFKGRERFCGVFRFFSKALFVIDLELIKRIMNTDFNSFADRSLFHNVRDDPLTGNLLLLDGEKWRWLRQRLTPVFSSAKMKFMFPTIVKVAEHLPLMAEQCLGVFEAKDLCARFTTDVIGSCAFGLDCNSVSNPDSEFRRMGGSAMKDFFGSGIVNTLMHSQPQLASKLRMRILRPEVSRFFIETMRQTLSYRKREKVKRNDLIQLLIELDEQTKGSEAELSLEQIAAQAMVFFLAGFDTSSTIMAFCLYELSLNPDIQSRLRQEILSTLQLPNQQLSYECMQQMTYLNQVVAETLRKYPIASYLLRRCTSSYKIPESDLQLEAGIKVMIPLYSIHHDADLYPDPDRFDPSRFAPEAVKTRHPYAYMPFGNGPRGCIGERFGIMQVKIGIITLIRHYNIKTTQLTQIPMQFSKRSFFTESESGIHLRMERISAK